MCSYSYFCLVNGEFSLKVVAFRCLLFYWQHHVRPILFVCSPMLYVRLCMLTFSIRVCVFIFRYQYLFKARVWVLDSVASDIGRILTFNWFVPVWGSCSRLHGKHLCLCCLLFILSSVYLMNWTQVCLVHSPSLVIFWNWTFTPNLCNRPASMPLRCCSLCLVVITLFCLD